MGRRKILAHINNPSEYWQHYKQNYDEKTTWGGGIAVDGQVVSRRERYERIKLVSLVYIYMGNIEQAIRRTITRANLEDKMDPYDLFPPRIGKWRGRGASLKWDSEPEEWRNYYEWIKQEISKHSNL